MVTYPRDYGSYPAEYADQWEQQLGAYPYAAFPTAVAPVDVIAHRQAVEAHEGHERQRRARVEPVHPSNLLAGSLTGSAGQHSDWRDALDCVATVTITPATANGVATTTVTFSALSQAALALLQAGQSTRYLLCIRTAEVAPSAATATGAILLSLVTSGGDVLPLGAYGASSVGSSLGLGMVGPSSIGDIGQAHTLSCQSVGVGAPVALTVRLGISLIIVRLDPGANNE